jgi:hypothetical protein
MRGSSWFAVFTGLCALAGLAAVSAADAASVPTRSAAARQYTLKIRGIDRAGKAVTIEPSVYGAANGADHLTYLSSVTVPAGKYVVAAAVPEPKQNSQTLVAKIVNVRSNMTVTLSAVKAVPVTATLSGLQLPQNIQANQQAMLCLRTGRKFVAVTGMLIVPTLVDGNAAPGAMYIKPMTGPDLRFVYQTYWEGQGPLYEEAAAHNGGIPASADYHQSVSGMAQVQVQLRASENATALRNVVESYDSCGSLTVPEESLPVSYADYRTPGPWQTKEYLGPSKITLNRVLVQTGTYQAGRSYSSVLGSAVAGPRADFPVIAGTKITFSPRGFFADPLVASTDCEGSGRVTLTPGLGSGVLHLCGKGSSFSRRPPRAGWYTMTAGFARPKASSVLLSTAVTMSWHFRYAPVSGHAVNAEAAPVTVTEFQPTGLGPSNNAQGGITTRVRVIVARSGGQPVATPRYPLASVKVQASFDNGKSWHSVALRSAGGGWLASIANPTAGGYVSLRSIVIDVKGDKTVETVTRAYLVDAG